MSESGVASAIDPGLVSGTDAPSGAKGYRGLAMEGGIARWYARTRGTPSQIAAWRRQAEAIVSRLPEGAEVLEVAPGPGYFAVELARTGRVHVTGLDISETFVQIAAQNARTAGAPVVFRLGDAARMPFPDASFDLVLTQAAFKNFSRPQAAVDEMYRVLRPGGSATIEDMRRDASDALVRSEVRSMGLGAVRGYFTRRALFSLRRRAYTQPEFARFAAKSPFGDCVIRVEGIGLEVRMFKPLAPPPVRSERLP